MFMNFEVKYKMLFWKKTIRLSKSVLFFTIVFVF